MSRIRLHGNRVLDHRGRDLGRLRKRQRRAELGGPPHNHVLQSGAARAWLGWTRADAVATLNDVARMAEDKGVPTHTLIFQTTDPRPAAARAPREALWRRYLRSITPHSAGTTRRAAMRAAAAETIAQHLVEEHGVHPDDTETPPAHRVQRILTGLEQPWRSIEPLLRLYLRISEDR